MHRSSWFGLSTAFRLASAVTPSATLSATLCALVFATLLGATACGGSSPTSADTTNPTAAVSPAVTELTIGQSQVYTLSLAAATDVITWTTSDATVLSIDAGGNATGVRNGTATLTATSSSGTSATLAVQVIPVYSGSWTGSTLTLACTDVAGYNALNYCAKLLGTSQLVTMTLSQSGYTVTGTMTKVEGQNILSGPISGNVGTSGELNMTGSLAGLSAGANTLLTVVGWNTLATGSSMTGTWSGNVTSPQVLGLATVQWSFTNLTLAQ